MDEESLQNLRNEARQLAVEMVKLLAARRDVVRRISEIKRRSGMSVLQPSVEAAVREAMVEEAVKQGVPQETVQRLATILFSDAVEIQQKPKTTLTHFDILRRAVELQREGYEVQRLEVGEPDLGAPVEVRQSVAEAVLGGFARYVDSKGIMELRTMLVKHVYDKYGLEIKPDNIIITPGGRFAIYLAVKTLLREGDELLVIDPSWPMYRQVAAFVGARSIHVRTTLEDGWTPIVDEIAKHISPATKAIVLNYPNNPTGKMIEKKTFYEIVDLAEQKNITVISDEVYADYMKNVPASILENQNARKHVLIQSFSKSYGMTGYRIGYVVADESLISKMASIMGLVLTCVPEFIQRGAITALSLKQAPKQYAEVMMRRMESAVRELEKLNLQFYRPDGGMYVFPRIGLENVDGMKLAFELLESKGVAVAPGSIFGGYDDFIRISLGAPEQSIAKGIRLLGEFLREKGKA
ncbi:MAG: aminotransferase class I/II-fold pyridoxal phosphate-dependent enzyme [Candidatus Caldarchaeum sp.]|nr:aminotransferase class I/II-fold pyridoxal phosphate-dependent enzyme [Candidatus Caldarchaeum sp.]